MDKSGNSEEAIPLNYLPLERFRELIAENDEEALNYYSFEDGLLYYATYRQVIATVNGVETNDSTYEITENPPIHYKSITNMCNMPFNFLFALLQESQNPDWVMAVIDLLLEDSKAVLMIQDQLNTVTYTKVETEHHVQRTDVEYYREVPYSGGTYWEWQNTARSYNLLMSNPIITTTVTTTYTNTANVYIKEAHTWCIDFEQEATKVETITPGEEVITLEKYTDEDFATPGGAGYIFVSSSGSMPTITRTYVSVKTLLYSTSDKINFEDYKFEVSPKYKEINYKKFLGLWKNKAGKYKKGEEYDENGIEVPYTLPDDETAKYYIPARISQENGQNINELLGLLELHADTQAQEDLMRYYWHIWMGEEVPDEELSKLLGYFDEKVFTSLIGGSIYGSSVEEKVWYALIEAGIPEFSAAGAMGNIACESSFIANSLNDKYGNDVLNITDEEYTEAVDNGTYTNFANDRIAYGLCQWMDETRKGGLLRYAQSKGVSISNENMQIEYMLAEMGISNAASSYATYNFLRKTINGKVYNEDAWRNAENESEAATAFLYSFGRRRTVEI